MEINKDELLQEEVTKEDDTNTQSDNETFDTDITISKYEGTSESNKEEITSDILSALEERGYISRTTESGAAEENVLTTESGASIDDIYSYVQSIDSHLEYITDHMYTTPSGHNVNTPLNDYTLTEFCLMGIIILLVLPIIGGFIKNHIITMH